MTYWTQFWRWTSSLSTLPLRMDKWLLSLPAGWKISFGIWIRYTVDSPGAPPSMALNGERTRYRHTPIDKRQGDIRLLVIYPGNPGDTISTSLVTSHLSDSPSFEAISYVWGNYSDRAQILVDGQLYCISKSLHDALHDLRHPDSVRTFWADQVCIDQSAESMAERSDQVGKMGQIYKTASNVVVYLGRGTEHTETDMQHLQSFIQPYARGEEAPWSHIPIPDLGRSINNILTSPWFERMWTVQEAVLAKKTTLQCGNYQVQWTCDLRTLRALVFRIKSAVISPVYHLHGTAKVDWTPLLYILESQMRQAARKEGVVLQRNLLDVAFDYRYRKCVQPRDRYFAVLGIIEDDRGGSMCFEPDYSISVEEVHRQFTAEIQRISEIEDAPLEEFRAVDPSSLPKCLEVDPSPFPRLGEPWIGSFTPICTSALNDTG